MPTSLQEGDTIAMQGEVTKIHDDGQVTVLLRGYVVPITTRGEHLNLVAAKKRQGESKRTGET
jgi:hypothetical protein